MKKLSKLVFVAVIPMMMACANSAGQTTGEVNTEEAVIETLMNRRSIRAYKDQPVEREKLQKVLECGIYAPNGMNAQTWEIRVVEDPAYFDGLSQIFAEANPEMASRMGGSSMFRNAPVVIFIANDTSSRFSPIDCGLLGGNIVNAAYAMGLGTCVMAGPLTIFENPATASYLEKLNFSEGYELLYCIGIGYPDETPEARPRDYTKIQYIE